MKRAVLISCLLLSAFSAFSAVKPDPERLADAIYRAEGGRHAKAPYGILSVKVKTRAAARRVCLRTIEHAWSDYSTFHPPSSTFIEFLADRYCPPSVDPVGNRNWKRNVTHFCQ